MLNPSYLISSSFCFNSANVYLKFYKNMLKFIFNLSLESVLKFSLSFINVKPFRCL